jgi:prephenate dehydrogenase
LTASGFRDTTRIAAGDPTLWTGIFVQNKPAVLAAVEKLRESLARYQATLEAGDTASLNNLLEQAKKVRDALGS